MDANSAFVGDSGGVDAVSRVTSPSVPLKTPAMAALR